MASAGMAKQARVSPSRRKPRDLTRPKVLDAALAIIDKTGADEVTMRGVADAVGVTPMALYNHFSSKRDLLEAISESVIGAAEFDGHQANWRDQVQHCFAVLRELCLRHPGLPRLLEFEGAVPASVVAPMEVTVRALREAGLDNLDSVRTYLLLTGFTLAQAAYQTRPIPDLNPSAKIRTERLELPAAWDFDASFAFGIALILNGVEANVRDRRG